MESVGVKPKFRSPVTALLGVTALIIWCPSITAINVVPGTNNLDSANLIGEIAFVFVLIPNLWATIQAWIWGYRKSALLLVALFIAYLILIYPVRLSGYLPIPIPLVIAVIFAFIPIAVRYVSAKGQNQAGAHKEG
jgi:hypothetical protein